MSNAIPSPESSSQLYQYGWRAIVIRAWLVSACLIELPRRKPYLGPHLHHPSVHRSNRRGARRSDARAPAAITAPRHLTLRLIRKLTERPGSRKAFFVFLSITFLSFQPARSEVIAATNIESVNFAADTTLQ